MKHSNDIVLAGCGNMGFALLGGWISRGGLTPENIHVVEPVDVLRERAASLGVAVYGDAKQLPEDLRPRAVILAVKPQVMADVLPAYRRFCDIGIFVSIAAGVSVATLEGHLGAAAVVRAMPNTPASVGMGATVVFMNGRVSEAEAGYVADLLEAVGAVHRVEEEKLIDAATAISGSGPAYVFHFIECLAQAGVDAGLPSETALALAQETVQGAGALAAASSDTPTILRQQVTSPKGTTAAALDVLMAEPGLAGLVGEAVRAAHTRAQELAAG